jgi:hypothetical protein
MIKNMDELLAEQVKRRTMDYAACLPSVNESHLVNEYPLTRESTLTRESPSVARLKILDDIDRVEIEQEVVSKNVRFSDKEEYAVA